MDKKAVHLQGVSEHGKHPYTLIATELREKAHLWVVI